MKNTGRCWLLGLAGFLVACGFPDLSPELSAIEIRAGGTLYVKREVRGLNYDVWALSADPDPCHAPNKDSDYIFEGTGPHSFVIGTENGVTTVYSLAGLRPPPAGQLEIRSEFVAPLDWDRVRDVHVSRGFVSVDEGSGFVRACKNR